MTDWLEIEIARKMGSWKRQVATEAHSWIESEIAKETETERWKETEIATETDSWRTTEEATATETV